MVLQVKFFAALLAADPGSCLVLPRGTGINASIRVKVNRVTTDLPGGVTLGQALAPAGTDGRSILSRLKVLRLHDGRLYPVEWDRTTDRILSLPPEGGEELIW